MPRISPEMTFRDIAEAIQRGELCQEDAEVSAALTERGRVALAAFDEIAALVDPETLTLAIIEDDANPSQIGDLLPLLGNDPAKLAKAHRAIGRIEDTIGPSEPGKACFRRPGGAV